MQPDGVGVPAYEFVGIHTADGLWALDTFLLSVDEYGHALFIGAFSPGFFHQSPPVRIPAWKTQSVSYIPGC